MLGEEKSLRIDPMQLESNKCFLWEMAVELNWKGHQGVAGKDAPGKRTSIGNAERYEKAARGVGSGEHFVGSGWGGRCVPAHTQTQQRTGRNTPGERSSKASCAGQRSATCIPKAEGSHRGC